MTDHNNFENKKKTKTMEQKVHVQRPQDLSMYKLPLNISCEPNTCLETALILGC